MGQVSYALHAQIFFLLFPGLDHNNDQSDTIKVASNFIILILEPFSLNFPLKHD